MSFKVEHMTAFTSLPIEPIKNLKISMGARGLYCFLYIQHDTSDINIPKKHLKYLDELIEYGYIEKYKGDIYINDVSKKRSNHENI